MLNISILIHVLQKKKKNSGKAIGFQSDKLGLNSGSFTSLSKKLGILINVLELVFLYIKWTKH